MPRVRVAQPNATVIKHSPREYALIRQLWGDDGTIDPAALQQLSKVYGDGSVSNKSVSQGSLTYEDAVTALKKTPPAVNDAANGHANGSTAAKGEPVLGWAVMDSKGHLEPYRFSRREVTTQDVRIQITHCGMCHSDLHQIKGEWGSSTFPMVPGHEIVGIVTEVGSEASGFRVGDRAGVGCFVDACRSCPSCKSGDDNYCQNIVFTYNSKDKEGNPTQGGYSTHITVDHRYVLHVPQSLPLNAAAPLLCAGITTYSPLRHFGLDKPGMKLGVVGLGGLGHMAVKFGKAFKMEVTVFSTSPGKKEEALERLGADHFVVSKDEQAMAGITQSLDGIIDCVSAKHPIKPYLSALKNDGRLVFVGLPPEDLALNIGWGLVSRRLMVSGSMIGGIRETQEMLDFCGEHGITCDIEEVEMGYVNEAMARLEKGDVHYRFVIDIAKSLVV